VKVQAAATSSGGNWDRFHFNYPENSKCHFIRVISWLQCYCLSFRQHLLQLYLLPPNPKLLVTAIGIDNVPAINPDTEVVAELVLLLQECSVLKYGSIDSR